MMTQDSHAVSGHMPRHIMKAKSKPKAIREGVVRDGLRTASLDLQYRGYSTYGGIP